MNRGEQILSPAEFTAWVGRRIDERAPAAVVRFGDGEAQLMEADHANGESMNVALRKLARQSPQPFSLDAVLEVKDLVSLAFERADVLGIQPGDRFTDEHKSWMSRLAALHAERVAGGRLPAVLAPCLLNHAVLESLPEMLAGRRVSVISCRDVKPVLEGEWGLQDVAVYQVPSQQAVRDVDGDYEAAMHDVPIWPDTIARVRAELTVREPGEVFLVGAGVFGKGLCIDIRDRGGIAIDMGSALDNIADKLTRGPGRRALEMRANGMSVDEIAERLSEVFETRVDSETVSRGIEEIEEEVAARRKWLETG